MSISRQIFRKGVLPVGGDWLKSLKQTTPLGTAADFQERWEHVEEVWAKAGKAEGLLKQHLTRIAELLEEAYFTAVACMPRTSGCYDWVPAGKKWKPPGRVTGPTGPSPELSLRVCRHRAARGLSTGEYPADRKRGKKKPGRRKK